jgi:hypothetical protein
MVGAMTAEVMDRKWSRVTPGVVVVVLSQYLPDSKRAGQAGDECQLFCVDLIEDCSIDKKLMALQEKVWEKGEGFGRLRSERHRIF